MFPISKSDFFILFDGIKLTTSMNIQQAFGGNSLVNLWIHFHSDTLLEER